MGLSLRLLGQRLVQRRADEVEMAVADETETVAEILACTRRALLADVRDLEEDGNSLLGWSQYFGAAAPPTAIGTSYGLRLVNLLGIYDPRVDRARLVETLRHRQQPGGGWCASSQRDIARPESTAWVLASAARSGLDSTTKHDLIMLLESMLDPATDQIGVSHTSVVTSVVSTLAELAPQSGRLDDLVGRLVQGATQVDERAGTVAWGATLQPRSQRSVAHTARAVCALTRMIATAQNPRPDLEELVDKAVRWLRAPADQAGFADRLRNTEEQVRRPLQGDRADVLVIGSFTAAWVARALLAAGLPQSEEHLRTAVGIVCRQQQKGIGSGTTRSRCG